MAVKLLRLSMRADHHEFPRRLRREALVEGSPEGERVARSFERLDQETTPPTSGCSPASGTPCDPTARSASQAASAEAGIGRAKRKP